ncbi:MAG: VOC family protein [Chloroflexota bacterium]|nr:VOC family protein [Chloroflexota bacterium]
MAAVLRLHHASVPMPVDGHDTAREFYGGVLGMTEVEPPSTLPAGSVVWFRVGGNGQEVHVYVEDEGGPNTPSQHLCLQVEDLAAFRERLDGHGVPVEEAVPIVNRPRGFVRDPFGNLIENLIELTQIAGDYA